MNLRLLRNMNYMVLAQAANYALPLVLIPYLVRTIGLAGFGDFSVAQSIINVGIILVQFGFNIYVTKDIAEKIKTDQPLDAIISATFIFQILLALLLILLAGIVYLLVPIKVAQLCFFYSFTWLGQALFPIWYFQGSQRFKQLALLNFLLRASTFVIVLIIIKQEQHLVYLPMIYSFSYLATGMLASRLMWKRHHLLIPTAKTLTVLANNTKDLFFSNVISVLLMNMPVFFLNHLVTKEEVGAFSAIMRVIFAIKGLINSSFQALIPALISGYDKLNHRSIVLTLLLVLVSIFATGTVVKDSLLTLLYGHKASLTYDTEFTLLLFSIIPGSLATLFIFVFASFYGAFAQRKHAFLRVFVVASLLYYPFILQFKGMGAAMIILLSETLLLFLGSRIIRNRKPIK